MQALFDLFIAYAPWIWLALAVLLFAAETVIPGMHAAFFGFAAAIVGIALLITSFGFSIQVLVFGVAALGAIAVGRPFYNRRQTSDQPDLNDRGLQYVGRTAVVEDAIRGGRGRVRLGDTVWAAEGPELPAGASVKVAGMRGTVLLVTRA